jgi:DNA-binding NarL/FixJ family response regulator
MVQARIVVGDPQDLIIEGLRSLLEPRYQIVAAVGDGKSLVRAALAFRPDLIAADFDSAQSKEKDFDALHQIRTRLPNARVLCLNCGRQSPGADACRLVEMRPEDF